MRATNTSMWAGRPTRRGWLRGKLRAIEDEARTKAMKRIAQEVQSPRSLSMVVGTEDVF